MDFRLGQKVSLKSKLHPELDDDYFIDGIFEPKDGDTLIRTMQPIKETLYSLKGLDGLWAEHSISEIQGGK